MWKKRPENRPETTQKIEVLLTFPTAEQGMLFAQWLRGRIMGRRGWLAADAVRVDYAACCELDAADNERGYHEAAMAQARIMILAGSPAWLTSRECMQQYLRFATENRRRAAGGRPPLKGLCLVMTDERQGMEMEAVPRAGWQMLPAARAPISEFPYGNLGVRGLTDGCLDRVMAAIP
ncbi:hypothetical protein EOD42_14575 [Rhodovarius crocodyli]|uniref:TIR domain-containing protein n=1 Tax=Rhodovarius crocodyli TaxID=1979269 RepID=A0A437MFC7_9PROT|nr:hypothetical protein [Rhodovarius crocodyli]RVT96330.1 hypothetical protein EOD42_14575 [Rhodovarius crocodyli]